MQGSMQRQSCHRRRSFLLAVRILSVISIIMLMSCVYSPKIGNHVVKDKVKVAKLHVQLGLALLENNNVSLAKQKFLQAKYEAPKEPSVWYGMGYFLERTGDVKTAEQHYRKAIDLHSTEGAARNNYATFLCRQGRYQEAFNEFNKAVEDSNYLQSAQAFLNASICASKIPDKQLAEAYLKKALEKDSSLKNSENKKYWKSA